MKPAIIRKPGAAQCGLKRPVRKGDVGKGMVEKVVYTGGRGRYQTVVRPMGE